MGPVMLKVYSRLLSALLRLRPASSLRRISLPYFLSLVAVTLIVLLYLLMVNEVLSKEAVKPAGMLISSIV